MTEINAVTKDQHKIQKTESEGGILGVREISRTPCYARSKD